MNYTKYLLKKSVYGNYQLVLYKDNEPIPEELKQSGNQIPITIKCANRAKKTVLDIAKNNQFEYFVTFSFDKKKIDRNNIELVKTKFLKALTAYNRKYNTSLIYVAVPEWHARKDAIHFHCLMSGIITESKEFTFCGPDPKSGHMRWRINYFYEKFGSVYALKIHDYSVFIAWYISKYMTKENLKIFFKRYFQSQGVKRSLILNTKSRNWDNKYKLDLVPQVDNGMFAIYEFDDLEILQDLIKMQNVLDIQSNI